MVIIQGTRHILRDRDKFTLYSCYNVSLQQITKKTCKERNQLLVHTLKNCNKSFVDKKSIICHKKKHRTRQPNNAIVLAMLTTSFVSMESRRDEN